MDQSCVYKLWYSKNIYLWKEKSLQKRKVRRGGVPAKPVAWSDRSLSLDSDARKTHANHCNIQFCDIIFCKDIYDCILAEQEVITRSRGSKAWYSRPKEHSHSVAILQSLLLDTHIHSHHHPLCTWHAVPLLWTQSPLDQLLERLARRCRAMNCSPVIGRMVGDIFAGL
jgi:hypothetical protein